MKALRSWRSPRAQDVLRLAGLVAMVLVTVQTFLRPPDALPPQLPPWVVPVGNALEVLMVLVFAAAFWRNTRAAAALATRGGVALLALQIAIALISNTDLLFIVAAEIPFVLPPRPAFAWLGAQAAATAVAATLLARGPGFEMTPGVEHLPRPLGVALTILVVIGWQAFAFCAGYMAATEARGRVELARVNAELQATQGLLADSSRLAERLQIARELHDTVGHHLTVLSVNLELVRQLVREERAAAALADAQTVTRLLLADVRDVVGALREERTIDLRRALEGLAAGTSQPRVHLAFPPGLEVREPAQAHALFRCAQEAITNAVRHARARNLWIEVHDDAAGGLRLAARDDGRGALAVEPGNGLRGMRERLEQVGGTLEIHATPGAGFALIAAMPGPLAPGRGRP
ncbi:MAG TPA: histidine kinase [Thermoanaerobaculia bacterium]|nr:histidine kinase [Thermoanaerobaculia bacterium]